MPADFDQHGVLPEGGGIVRQYLLSVVVSFLLCGLLLSLVSDPALKASIRMVSGVFLAVIVLKPLPRMDLHIQNMIPDMVLQEAEEICSHGERIAQQEQAWRIREDCEAYILSRSGMADRDIHLEIILDQSLIPTAAIIQGDLSWQDQSRLEEILTSDLGITKENQQWIGIQEKNGS